MSESDEEKFIEELIKIYNERKRETMSANPFSIFFLKNGKRITLGLADELKRKPEPSEVIEKLKYEWKVLPDNRKSIFTKAAIDLGYIPKELFANNPEMRAKVDARIKAAKEKTRLFKLI